MKCPQCKADNAATDKFCRQCGSELKFSCSQCGSSIYPEDKFCGKCGQRLDQSVEKAEITPAIDGERKHVTVLFSDLSGFTAMSEKLDPEEVKEVTSRIFGEVALVVTKYEGFIEKFIGDAVMAVFGVPNAHEDDPVRAIRSAKEIHEIVESMSPQLKGRIGRPLSMHSGINSGLVVTGEVELEKGTHGIAGDAINLAARLQDLADKGEILVGPETYRQAEGHFIFDELSPTQVKGKQAPIRIYRVLSAKERPDKIHRLSGVRADLIGRRAEIAELKDTVKNLHADRGRIFSICGDAGTGKSRLVEEFKSSLDFEKFEWVEGHAYAYAQNIPYFPLVDLMNRVFQIEEDDSPDKIRQKIESGVTELVDKKDRVAPYLGSLYSLSYPEIEAVSPEYWKTQIYNGAQMIISALARRAPTVFLLEDLHWADPSFVELLRHTLLEVQQPAIVLCVYRPVFSLFTANQARSLGKIYQEIRLRDLSASEAQDMLESLLKTGKIPAELRRFVQNKAEGNPFYLEELINSLIETETLSRDNGAWKLTRPITEADISSTIHGVITGRIDRLEKETKRILQEASVIGRAFFYDILKRITEIRHHCDACLSSLERLDLIRTRTLQPDIEYVFKHALAQEVVYNGLLKKERQEIHERIALVMEQTFQDRLPEFYETLAYHFAQGHSDVKAVDYLMKSGEKSFNRYSIKESYRYYKEAFELLRNKPNKSNEEDKLLIDILIKWASVFMLQANFKELSVLLNTQEKLALSLNDKSRLGLYYVWLGHSLDYTGKLTDAYKYLHKALRYGEEIKDKKIIGYASALLTWTCVDLGLLDEAVACGERAYEISKLLETDYELYLHSLPVLGYSYMYRGESQKVFEIGKTLLDYGKRLSNPRFEAAGHWLIGYDLLWKGKLSEAIENNKKGLQLSVDHLHSLSLKLVSSWAYLLEGQIEKAEQYLKQIVTFSENFSWEKTRTPAYLLLGLVFIAKGRFSEGLRMMEESRNICNKNQRKLLAAYSEYLLGKVFLQIVEGAGPKNLATFAKNIVFLIKNVPFAAKKAEAHFNKALEVSKKIGVKPFLGLVYLDLGLLYKATKRTDNARDCFSNAINIFEQCEAEMFLKQTKEAFASLE